MKPFMFLLEQPIHQSLRQLRLVSISAILWCFYELHTLMAWYMLNADIGKNGDVAFFAFAAALLAAIWKSISSITEVHNKDD